MTSLDVQNTSSVAGNELSLSDLRTNEDIKFNTKLSCS